MSKFVRVELENGALATVPAAVAETAGIKPLDGRKHPALDKKGRPLPVEYPEQASAPAEEDGGKPAADNPPAGS